MIPLTTIQDLFDYNYWARDRQLERCAQVSQEQFVRPMGSSFSSLRDTVAHLVGAEWIWLERWRGKSPTMKDTQEFAAEKFPTLGAVQERWQTVEAGVREYLARLTEQGLVLPLTYVNVRGETWTYPLWQTLFHVVNHQTYHRGQVTTILRQLGVPAAPIDYLVAQDSRFRRQSA
jgi:uncharacterized damage-inducible protein DinB